AGQPPVGRLGLRRQEREVAVDGEPLPAAPLEHEGAPARPRDRTAVGPGDFGQPAAGDPRAIARRVHARVPLEVEIADAGPDVLPLLANDVVQARHGAGPGAEGHRVGGEQLSADGKVAGADGGLERAEPVLGCRHGRTHGGIMQRKYGMLLVMPLSRRPLRVLHTADVHLELDVVVWGRAMEEHEPGFQPLAHIPGRDERRWHLAMAHGFFYEARQRPDRSSPIFADEIRDTGWDYVALGHQHVQTDVSQGTVTACYAGAPAIEWVGASPEGAVLRIDFSVEAGIRVESRRLR